MRSSIECGAQFQSILQLRWIDDEQAEAKLFRRTSFRTSKASREKERTRSRKRTYEVRTDFFGDLDLAAEANLRVISFDHTRGGVK
jgi:hypothetical protein